MVALGSPLSLQNSVTAGIVSCVDRKAVELGLAGAWSHFIQVPACRYAAAGALLALREGVALVLLLSPPVPSGGREESHASWSGRLGDASCFLI